MCTVDVTCDAEPALARLLIEMRDRLAQSAGVDPGAIRIGPVDLGGGP